MQNIMKVLFVDASTGYYRMRRYKVGDYFGPVDLGLHISDNYKSFELRHGAFGRLHPARSNRLIFSGFSPCWRGFYVSSMGGAGLVFDNLGLNLVSIVHRAPTPSVLYLNRVHARKSRWNCIPWTCIASGHRVAAACMRSWTGYTSAFTNATRPIPAFWPPAPPRTSRTPAPSFRCLIKNGKLTHVDTWAGRGGLGSKMVQDHGIVAVIYCGTVVDEDFRDRNVADEWFRKPNTTSGSPPRILKPPQNTASILRWIRGERSE